MSASNRNVPKRRFKQHINDDPWEQRELSQLNTFFTDGNYGESYPKSTDLVNKENGVPFLTGGNLRNGVLNVKGANYITKEKHAKLTSGHLEYDDIVIAVRGSLGALGYVKVENVGWNINSQLALIRTEKKNLRGGFLLQFLISDKGQNSILSKITGSALKQLPMNQLKTLIVPVTEIPEQIKIEQLFNNIDSLITLHQRKLDKMKNLKSAYLTEMFPAEGEAVPKRRFAGFTDPWEQRKVYEYASFLKGNGLNWNDITDDGKQECILYGNLYTDYGMIAEDVVYRTNKQLKTGVYSKFGDVLVPASDTTPTGLARATSIEKSGVLLGGDINVIRPNENLNGSCLSLAINAKKQELIKLIKGTTVKHIYNSDIKNIDISLPRSSDEQEQIVSLFKDLDNLITLHQRKLEKLQNLKKSYLNEMFV